MTSSATSVFRRIIQTALAPKAIGGGQQIDGAHFKENPR
jgi:hypothetical protein